MAKKTEAGALRTAIIIQSCTKTTTSNGYPSEEWKSVFDDGRVYRCKWVNAYGKEVFDAKQAGLEEVATLTMRYTSKLTPVCRVLKGGDARPYEVISVNDVEDRHVWLEVKVHRRVESR